MATVWAKQNGEWNGSIWDYFNEETEQVEAYPYAKPQSNDIVYLNGFTISANENINIGNGTIRNDLNPYTNLSGGKITIPSSLANMNGYVNANIIGGDVFTINSTQSNVFTFIGNIKLTNRLFNGFETLNKSVTINGNVDNSENPTYIYSSRGFLFTINGNVIKGNSSLYVRNTIQTGTTPITINGNLTTTQNATNYIGENVGAVTFNIGNIDFTNSEAMLSNNTVSLNVGNFYFIANQTGQNVSATNIIAENNAILTCNTLNINGSITYKSTNNMMGVKYNTLNILNPDTFTWKDITEPRVNQFIILTDAEMNNRQQYPPENEVKEGVEYVWGEKVGTYQQPPESVVLSGYEYDTITAEENDIAIYNAVRYIYADYGTLHWFELKTTTTDIVTTPSQQSITIGGETVVADTDYVVEYNDVCYQWSGSAWGSITTKNIGTVKTDIVTNPTETTLVTKKGTLETSNLPQTTLDRMANALTVDIFQQILDAHLNN